MNYNSGEYLLAKRNFGFFCQCRQQVFKTLNSRFWLTLYNDRMPDAGESILEYSGYGSSRGGRRRPCGGVISRLLKDTADMAGCPTTAAVSDPSPPLLPSIGPPLDFRRVSAVVDVDVLPPTQRRVQLMRAADDRRPLGFFIRDSVVRPGARYDQHAVGGGGIFISRLVAGGLAAGTGLLAVNDEVLEVNGIDVAGKTLDQVTVLTVNKKSELSS